MDSKFLQKLYEYSLCEKLPEHGVLFDLANRACEVLDSEKPDYRPCSKNKKPGGLLDFTTSKTEKLPVLVVPDIHARADFLYNILIYPLPVEFTNCNVGLSVYEALSQNKIRVVCVGDLLHSELRGRMRWIQALEEYDNNNFTGEAMTSEMKEGLNLLSMVMELKCAFPENFHVLKGNHENITNRSEDGDFSFCKFANEGEMVRLFMEKYYGDDMLYIISCFEQSLPLLCAFNECLISHGEPLRAYSSQELVEGLCSGEVVKGLTWTSNNQSQVGSVEAMLCTLTGRNDFLNARYLAGHRPVKENYALRQNGFFVQFHNPERQNVALVWKGKVFNPETDIVNVKLDI